MSDHELDCEVPPEAYEYAPWECFDAEVLTKLCLKCGKLAEVPDRSHCGHIFGNEPEHKENPDADRPREEPATGGSDEWGDSNRDHDSVQFDPLAMAVDPAGEDLDHAISQVQDTIAPCIHGLARGDANPQATSQFMDSIIRPRSDAGTAHSDFARQSTPFCEFLAGKSRVRSHLLIVWGQATLDALLPTMGPAASDPPPLKICFGKPCNKKARSKMQAGEIAFVSTTAMGGH